MKHSLLFSIICLAAFSTPAQRFAVLSDIHVSPGNANDSVLRVAIDEINASPFDAVIVNGDLTNEGSDLQLHNVATALRRVSHPLHVLPGNHEDTWSQSATKTFVDIFGTDRFLAVYDSIAIVGINCGPYMKMGDGHIKQEDLHWLQHKLDSLSNCGLQIISFNHYPIRENALDNYHEYSSLLNRYPVLAHINGHFHKWIRYDVGEIEAAMTRALSMGKNNYGYAIVEVSPEWIKIYDKEIGKQRKPMYAFARRDTHGRKADTTVATSAKRTITQPDGFEITPLWTDSASVFTRLCIDNDNVYFGTSTGLAKAIDKHSGELRWSIAVPDRAPLFSRSVRLKGNDLSIPHASGIIIADSKSGKIKRSLKSKQGPYVADGLLCGDTYYQGGYKRFEARDATAKKLLWSYDSINNYCQAAPTVRDNDVIFGAWDTKLRCLDRNTGKLRWSWHNAKKANIYSPGNVVPVVTHDRVFVVTPDRYITAIDRHTGKELWRDNSHRYRESMGASEDSTAVYAKTMDGTLVAVSAIADNFKELWTVDMGIGYDHAPCVVVEKDGIVYAGSRRGILTAIDAATHRKLWSVAIGNSEINGIDLDPTTSHLYVSLIEGTIFRIKFLRGL